MPREWVREKDILDPYTRRDPKFAKTLWECATSGLNKTIPGGGPDRHFSDCGPDLRVATE
jgi:hypothetical protein